jgi:hypothetical protein
MWAPSGRRHRSSLERRARAAGLGDHVLDRALLVAPARHDADHRLEEPLARPRARPSLGEQRHWRPLRAGAHRRPADRLTHHGATTLAARAGQSPPDAPPVAPVRARTRASRRISETTSFGSQTALRLASLRHRVHLCSSDAPGPGTGIIRAQLVAATEKRADPVRRCSRSGSAVGLGSSLRSARAMCLYTTACGMDAPDDHRSNRRKAEGMRQPRARSAPEEMGS